MWTLFSCNGFNDGSLWALLYKSKEKHSVSLFSPPSLKVELSGRLSWLVEVSQMMLYVSSSAKHSRKILISLEKNLPEFRAKAHISCSFRQTECSSRKETAEAEGYHHKQQMYIHVYKKVVSVNTVVSSIPWVVWIVTLHPTQSMASP